MDNLTSIAYALCAAVFFIGLALMVARSGRKARRQQRQAVIRAARAERLEIDEMVIGHLRGRCG